MATYTSDNNETKQASAVQRHDAFRIQDGDGETVAECIVEERHGVLWVKSFWVKSAYRGYRLGSEVLRAVGGAYSDKPLYLLVQAFDGAPKTDEELIQMYANFGYKPTNTPGVLCRDYSQLKVSAPVQG